MANDPRLAEQQIAAQPPPCYIGGNSGPQNHNSGLLRQMVDSAVLVLNQNYEPLNVCNIRRAFVLLDLGKAEMLEEGDGLLRSMRAAYPWPSVIRLVYMIRRPRPQMRLTRREVFQRDHFTCMYCGEQGKDLTLDHVIPRYRGGRHTWENLVSACKHCNHRKAGRTLQEARMRLIREPFHPRASAYYAFYPYLDAKLAWRKFIPGWEQANRFEAEA
jgi:5-methylcytosine-specific restriction endonuclease McrA